MAAILSAVVAIRDAAFSEMGAGRVGLDLASIIAFYFFCALIIGSVVGAARPALERPFVAAVIGVLAAWPCMFLLEIIEANPSESLGQRAMDTTVLAVILGIGGSMVLRGSSKRP